MVNNFYITKLTKKYLAGFSVLLLLLIISPYQHIAFAEDNTANCGNLSAEDCIAIMGPWQDYVSNDSTSSCSATKSDSDSSGPNSEVSTPTTNLKEFVDKYGQSAFNVGKQFGIPYEAILSQAILESGYGGSDLTTKGFNFFGIKAGSSWKGRVITLRTREQRKDGSEYFVLADFRAYDSAEDGFRGYGEFITSNPRYKNALNFPGDPFKYIEEIRKAGYATALDYVTLNHKLIKSIKAYISETKAFVPSSEVTPDVSPPTVGTEPSSNTGCNAPSDSSTPIDPTGSKAIAKSMLDSKNYEKPNDEMVCLDKLWTKESGWKFNAINDAEGNNDKNKNRLLDMDKGEEISDTEDDAYGIPQSKPGGKMSSKGSDWRTNPNTQIAWGLEYIEGRYKTPCGAWSHSESIGWY